MASLIVDYRIRKESRMNKFEGVDNFLMDRKLTEMDHLNMGITYIVTRRVERFPNNKQTYGIPKLRIIYEVELGTNTRKANTHDVIDFLTQEEYEEFRIKHGVKND